MDRFISGMLGSMAIDKDAPLMERFGVAREIGLEVAIPMGIITGQEVNEVFALQVKSLREAPEIRTVREVTSTRSTCDCGAMDKVLVATFSKSGLDSAKKSSNRKGIPLADHIRPITITVMDGHSGKATLAQFDIDDAEQLVNRLMEAIAEAREAYGVA